MPATAIVAGFEAEKIRLPKISTLLVLVNARKIGLAARQSATAYSVSLSAPQTYSSTPASKSLVMLRGLVVKAPEESQSTT